MEIEVEAVTTLRFADGSPVRAASAVARLGDGWLVVQDDATHAAWVRFGAPGEPSARGSLADRPRAVDRVRVLPAVTGLDTFEESAGTKHLKPDLEAAFELPGDGDRDAVVLLGSGSSPARMRAALMSADPGVPDGASVHVADLAPLYAAVGRALDVVPDLLNLEGACVVDDVLRWFHRGLPSAGVPTASVDVDLAALLEAIAGSGDPAAVPLRDTRRYDLGEVRSVGLAVTDAVRLPDGRILVSAAAEDAPNPRDDGPVVGAVLAVLDGHVVVGTADLPRIDGCAPKVEGLALVGSADDGAHLLATLDADDPAAPSLAVALHVRW